MGIIHINKLKPGMVLAQEVRDINGRLLLKSQKEIHASHIRIFKTWGVTEVNIRGNNGSRDTSTSPADPELIEKTREKTRERFSHADLDHPAMKEISEEPTDVKFPPIYIMLLPMSGQSE